MKKFLNKILVFIIILFIFIIILNGLGNNSICFAHMCLFFLTSILCVYGILKDFDSHSFSLLIIHYLFIIIFFVIAPMIQISFGKFPWNTNLSYYEIITIQFFIILWIVFYNIGTFFGKKKKNNNTANLNNNSLNSFNNIKLFFLTLLSIISAVIIVKNVGFYNLFSRSSSSLTFDGAYSKMTTLIISNFTRITILFSLVASYINYKNCKKGLLFLIINAFLLLLTSFPTGLSRNTAGIIYMGLFAVFYFCDFNKIKDNIKYIALFLVAFIILFPAINVFRNKQISEVNLKDTFILTINNISNNYISGDYDAFAMIGNVKKYVNINGSSYGKQFVGNLLFFVPRNIWQSKPVGSGSLVFSDFGYQFTNVSCPLIAEWYINFGLFGIIFGGILFGFICSSIDKKYWLIMNDEKNKLSYTALIYPFLVPAFFFMMRGDFLSTFSYSFSYIFLFWIYYNFLKVNLLKK